MRKTKEAFSWIIKILRKHAISFQITGGLAARIYGSKRPLADIDIELPDKKILAIQNEVKRHGIYGPKRYRDREFDLLYMTLKYKGQEIDLCGINSQKIFNKQTKKWEKECPDLAKAKRKKVYQRVVPVTRLEDLTRYKKKIDRAVDRHDLSALIPYLKP